MTAPSITRKVVATAGHVDHGKTSLVRALTGVEGDRLPIERARGITIELGFAPWELAGCSVGLVDVPGHERFVGTMAAGASGIDAVILVVAADDAVMPQTREHLAICAQLGVTRGIVVVTKIDLVDDAMLALVEADVRDATVGTFLAQAEIVRCSTKDGRGLPDIGPAMLRALAATPPRPTGGPPWLSVDRAFTKHGHGTVVTGTLVRGTVAIDDTLDLWMDGEAISVGVRGLAIHGAPVERARAATRLALQLRGVEADRIARGAVITANGWQASTRSIDVVLDRLDPTRAVVPSATAEVWLHLGAARITVRVKVTSRAEDARVGARLTSDAPFVTHAGERFVLRTAERTIGGGRVVDPHPALARPKKTVAPFDLEAALDSRARTLAMIGERPRGATRRELTMRLAPETRLEPILSALVREGVVVEASADGEKRWLAAGELERAKKEVRAALVAFHRTHPAAAGATVGELTGGVAEPWRPLVPLATAALVREGAIAGGDRVAAIGHDALVLADRVSEIYRRAGRAAITEEVALAESGLPERTFQGALGELVRTGTLVRIATGLVIERAALDAIVADVRAFFDTHETLSPGDFKALTGWTRKSAIALLEWLDRAGITRRRGEARIRA